MMIFPSLRTKRIAVQLRELALGEAIAICGMPADRYEATTTEFLKFVASNASQPTPGYVTNPRLWTVEERARVLTHYLSQVSESGADFTVGTNAKLSDYLKVDQDLAEPEIPLGKLAGRELVLRPLLGVHAELLETICKTRGDWVIGLLACQVQEGAQIDYLSLTDIQLIDWIGKRMAAVRALPESEFGVLLAAFEANRDRLTHFFVAEVGSEGVVFMPIAEEAGPGTPARFPAVSCVSSEVRRIFG